METQHRFQSYDGTPLVGTLAGGDAASGSIVLMVHGITSSRDEFGLFSGLADYLAKREILSFRFDYRCHGVNQQPMERLTLSGIVNDIEAAAVYAMQVSRASRIHVVGMSFGGGLSAFWASNTNAPVSSVVMMAPVLDYEEDILGQHGLLADKTLAPEAVRQLAAVGFVEAEGISYGSALVNELPYITGTAGLSALACPSLILHGDADTIVPYESSARFVTLNPRCRLVNIIGTDHGFGVEGDDDLTSPETKSKHTEVFGIVSEFFGSVESA